MTTPANDRDPAEVEARRQAAYLKLARWLSPSKPDEAEDGGDAA